MGFSGKVSGYSATNESACLAATPDPAATRAFDADQSRGMAEIYAGTSRSCRNLLGSGQAGRRELDAAVAGQSAAALIRTRMPVETEIKIDLFRGNEGQGNTGLNPRIYRPIAPSLRARK
jgi:hypothetical protein